MMISRKNNKEKLTEATIKILQGQEEIDNKQNYNEQLTLNIQKADWAFMNKYCIINIRYIDRRNNYVKNSSLC